MGNIDDRVREADELRLVGYTDWPSAFPGDRVELKVSSEHPTYDCSLVRLLHGDENPRGPGFIEEVILEVARDVPGQDRPIPTGSFVRIAVDPTPHVTRSFTFQMFVMPTELGSMSVAMAANWDRRRRRGWALLIDTSGRPLIRIGVGSGHVDVVVDVPMHPHVWHAVTLVVDATEGTVSLRADILPTSLSAGWSHHATSGLPAADIPSAAATDVLLLGRMESDDGVLAFNGKIEAPRMFSAALDDAAIDLLVGGGDPSDQESIVSSWDFSVGIPTVEVHDEVGGAPGRVVNMPGRAVTGRLWDGSVMDWRDGPSHYGAIHLHDDDLEDAAWEPDVEVQLPPELPSGVYAARLRAGGDEDHVPFIVRPEGGGAQADVALLFSTVTYQVYANDPPFYEPRSISPAERYALEQKLLSGYSAHSDGSAVHYVPWRRPLLNIRPRYRGWAEGASHNLGGDLDIVHWLTQAGRTFDALTEHDLHSEGIAMIEGYSVVITGHHPEYWSGPMRSALVAYLRGGGRLMYLGGNGFQTAVSFHEQAPHVLEVRRPEYMTWPARVGEWHHSTTGELGGNWEQRGHPEHALVGVGVGAVFELPSDEPLHGHPYRRLPPSYDDRAAWIFGGVEAEVIGAFNDLKFGGAAGGEVDSVSDILGTPAHALHLARAEVPGYADYGRLGGVAAADMVYFETPKGGAVFSVGSMDWCGALSFNGYDNDVARITGNVLTRFADRGWMVPTPPWPA